MIEFFIVRFFIAIFVDLLSLGLGAQGIESLAMRIQNLARNFILQEADDLASDLLAITEKGFRYCQSYHHSIIIWPLMCSIVLYVLYHHLPYFTFLPKISHPQQIGFLVLSASISVFYCVFYHLPLRHLVFPGMTVFIALKILTFNERKSAFNDKDYLQ